MSAKPKPRAIGLVRVSQRRGDDSEHSPEVQADALEQMAADHGWSLDELLDENVDNGRVRKVSGGADLSDREKLQWAVEQIEAGRYRILAAEHFDRLFRNIAVQRQVVIRVEAVGGEVWERSGRISHKRAADKFTATIKGASSEYVKDAAEERSFDAVERAIGLGKVPWSQTAPGYLRNKDSTLRRDPELLPVIRKAFQMRAGKARILDVRDYLGRHGIERSYHGTMHLLRDRIYLGEIHFGRHTPNLEAHDAIIDRELFDAVQARKDPRGPKRKSNRLLARLGVLICGGCGSRMIAQKQTQGGRRYAFYRCGKAVTADCPDRQSISARYAEDVVVAATRERIAHIERQGSTESGYRQAQAELKRAQVALDKATKSYREAGIDQEPAAVGTLIELREARDELAERAEQLARTEATVRFRPGAQWDELTRDEQREYIVAVVERATVYPPSPERRGRDRIEVELRD